MDNERLEDAIAQRLADYQQQLDCGQADVDTHADAAELSGEFRQRVERGKQAIDLLGALKRATGLSGLGTLHKLTPSRNAVGRHPQRVGRFTIIEQLGTGGFGIVYRALDPTTLREVAVKIPRLEALSSVELGRRFELEAQATAKLNHPNIVAVLEAGTDGLLPYIVSVYYPGQTLAAWLRANHGKLSPKQAAQLVATLAEAVEHAHQNGVWHRDIKPENVLLVASASISSGEVPLLSTDELVPKLMDFGLAKLTGSTAGMTQSGMLLGTIRYMAPEQAHGRTKDIGPASDIYSLGAVLYELLSGHPPYAADSDIDVLRKLGTEPPGRISSAHGRVPAELHTICLKCLRHEPHGRYATAGKLALDLRRYLAGEPIEARPAGAWEVGWKWARRRPAAAALVAVSLASLVGTAIGVSVYNVRLQEITRLAQASEQRAQDLLYSTDMQLAQQALNSNHLRQSQQVLARHEPRPDSVDRRELAWNFLSRVMHRDSGGLPKLPGDAYGLEFSPDGRLLATTCRDGRLRVWQLPDRKLIHDLSDHEGESSAIAFSHDGTLLATGGDDGRVVLRRTTDFSLLRLLEHHDQTPETPGISGIEFSSDDQKLYVTAGYDLYVWNPHSGATLAKKEKIHGSWVRGFDLAPNGNLLVTVRGNVNVWRTSDLEPVSEMKPPVDTLFSAAHFLPDSQQLLVSDSRGRIEVYDALSGERLRRSRSSHSTGALVLDYSPQRRLTLSGGQDGMLQLSDSDGNPFALLRGPMGRIWAGKFAPDGSRFVSGSADGEIRFWDVPADDRFADENNLVTAYEQVHCAFSSAVYSADGRLLAVGGSGSATAIVDRESFQVLLLPTAVMHGSCLGFTPDSRYLISAGNEGDVCVWNVSTGELVGTRTTPRGVCSLSVSPAGDRFAITAEDDHSLCIYDWPELRLLHTLRDSKLVEFALFDATGRDLIVGRSGELALLDAQTLKPRWQIGRAGEEFFDAAFLPGGSEIVVAEGREGVALRERASGGIVARLAGHPDKVVGVAASPAARNLASVCNAGVLRLWDRATLQSLLTFEGNRPPRRGGLCFSPAGDELAITQTRSNVKIMPSRGSVGRGTTRTSKPWPIDMRHWELVQRRARGSSAFLVWSANSDRWLQGLHGDDGFLLRTSRPDNLSDWSGEGEKSPQPVVAAAFTVDGSRALCVLADGQVQWRQDEQLLPQTYAIPAGTKHIALGSSDQRLAYADGAALVFASADTGAEIARSEQPAAIVGLQKIDDRMLVTAGADGAVRKYDLNLGTQVGPPVMTGKSAIGLAVSTTGRMLAVVTSDHRVHLLDSETLSETRSFDIAPQVRAVFFVDDDRWLACDLANQPLWNVEAGLAGPCLPVPIGGEVLSASPDGHWIAIQVEQNLAFIHLNSF